MGREGSCKALCAAWAGTRVCKERLQRGVGANMPQARRPARQQPLSLGLCTQLKPCTNSAGEDCCVNTHGGGEEALLEDKAGRRTSSCNLADSSLR